MRAAVVDQSRLNRTPFPRPTSHAEWAANGGGQGVSRAFEDGWIQITPTADGVDGFLTLHTGFFEVGARYVIRARIRLPEGAPQPANQVASIFVFLGGVLVVPTARPPSAVAGEYQLQTSSFLVTSLTGLNSVRLYSSRLVSAPVAWTDIMALKL